MKTVGIWKLTINENIFYLSYLSCMFTHSFAVAFLTQTVFMYVLKGGAVTVWHITATPNSVTNNRLSKVHLQQIAFSAFLLRIDKKPPYPESW